MRETLELRVDFDRADGLFGPDEGTALGIHSTRKVLLSTTDPRLPAIQQRQLALRREGKTLYTGWTYHRRYTKGELRDASLLALSVGWSSEVSGDRAGTVYTTATACPVCGAGVTKLSPLRVHLGKLPRIKDIVRGHTGEFVVSSHFVAAYSDAGAIGAVFVPVEFRRAPAGKAPAWFEMRSSADPISMLGGTRFAGGALPDVERDAEYLCPLGDRFGYYRISEVRLTTATPPAADVVETREYLGGTPPHREMLISGRLYHALIGAGIRGLGVEIARLA
ncbi:MAG: hypothetical protein ABIT20_03560 [Gemmatimonadaceae bacterium]